MVFIGILVYLLVTLANKWQLLYTDRDMLPFNEIYTNSKEYKFDSFIELTSTVVS